MRSMSDKWAVKLKKWKNYSMNDKAFFVVSFILLTIFFLLVLYPCVFVLSSSFSSGKAVQAGKVILFPVDFSLQGYKTVFANSDVWSGFFFSLFYTIVGTAINLVVTMICAYCMSRNDLRGRNGFMLFFTFTMFFSGGMIPNYLLMDSLHLINTRWALLLPGAMGVYNMIVARTFIMSNIPIELLEASQMDGCSDIRYFINVVLPLSKTVIAVLLLFYGVGHWNSYFSAMIYLNDRDMFPLTLFLREILALSKIDPSSIDDPDLVAKLQEYAATIKYALIVVSMVPVMLVYPFVQKHFVKGVMIGSVKG